MDEAVMQDEYPIREVLESLSDLGRVMLVVDQPGSLLSLLLAIADDIGVDTGFITPTAMAKAIEMYGAEIKTDAHDARIIAEVCMGLPQLIKPIDTKGNQLFETIGRQAVKIEGSEHIEELIKLEATYLHTHLQSRKLIEEKKSVKK